MSGDRLDVIRAYWMGDAWRSVAADLDGLYYFEQQITADGTVNIYAGAFRSTAEAEGLLQELEGGAALRVVQRAGRPGQ